MSRPEPALAVTVSRVVEADPASVYHLLSDITTVGDRSPETTSARWLGGGAGAIGDRFSGRNKIGFLTWSTVCTVTRAEPGQEFAFEVAAPSSSRWSFRLEPTDEGTRVVETVERDAPQPAALRVLQRLAGVRDRREHLRQGMITTLDRVAAAAAVR